MKEIKFSIGERLSLSNLLSEIYQAGGLHLGTLKTAFNVVGKMEIKEQERKDIKMKQQGASVTWDPKKDKEKNFEFSGDEVKLMKEAIKSKNEKKAFTLADRHIISIAEKLELEFTNEN